MLTQLRCPACYQLISTPREVTMVPEHRAGSKACWGTGQQGWPGSFPLRATVVETESGRRAEPAPGPPLVARPQVAAVPAREVDPTPSRSERGPDPAKLAPQGTPTHAATTAGGPSGDIVLRVTKALAAIGGMAALIALLSMPIEYYTALRWVLTASLLAVALAGTKSVLASWRGEAAGDNEDAKPLSVDKVAFWFLVGLPGLLGFAVLFNPLVPIYLGNRAAWGPFDMAVAVVLGAAALLIPQPTRNEPAGPHSSSAGAFVTLAGWILGVAILLAMMFSLLQDDYQGRPDCDTSYGLESGC